MKKIQLIFILTIALNACSTQEVKIVQTGPDTYSIIKKEAGYSGIGVLQSKITKAAQRFCTTSHKRLNILMLYESKPPFSDSRQPRAEIKFRCTSNDNPN